MPQINTGSELLEVVFTSQEKNTAMQLMDKNLSIMYLTNTKINILRQLAEQEFDDPETDAKNQRVRAYLKGQYDLLTALIQGALEPEPVEVDTSAGNPFHSSPQPLQN